MQRLSRLFTTNTIKLQTTSQATSHQDGTDKKSHQDGADNGAWPWSWSLFTAQSPIAPDTMGGAAACEQKIRQGAAEETGTVPEQQKTAEQIADEFDLLGSVSLAPGLLDSVPLASVSPNSSLPISVLPDAGIPISGSSSSPTVLHDMGPTGPAAASLDDVNKASTVAMTVVPASPITTSGIGAHSLRPAPNEKDGPILIVNFSDIEFDKNSSQGVSSSHRTDHGTFLLRKYSTEIGQQTHGEARKPCVVKHPKDDNVEMIYVEAFLNELARVALGGYGLAPTYVTYTKGHNGEGCVPVGLCSEKIANLKTCHKVPITAKQLQDPVFARRLAEIMILDLFGEEDDEHSNNLSNDDESKNDLCLFDKDCFLWRATKKIKGGRNMVDTSPGSILLPGQRIAETAFKLDKPSITQFPLTSKGGWYGPHKDTVILSLFTDNPFTSAETTLVREHFIGDPETQSLILRRAVDWMVDVLPRMMPIAHLNIPKNLTTKDGVNVLAIYDELQKIKMAEFDEVFTDMMELYREFASSRDEMVVDILARCLVRNFRFECQKSYAPLSRHADLDAAKIEPGVILDRINHLIERVKQNVQPKDKLIQKVTENVYSNLAAFSFIAPPKNTKEKETDADALDKDKHAGMDITINNMDELKLSAMTKEEEGGLLEKAYAMAEKWIQHEISQGSIDWRSFYHLQHPEAKSKTALTASNKTVSNIRDVVVEDYTDRKRSMVF